MRAAVTLSLVAVILGLPSTARGDFAVGFATGDAHVTRLTSVPLTVDGRLGVEFHSDPGTCAAVGRCGLAGTVSWRPSRRGQLQILEAVSGGRRRADAYVVPTPESFGRRGLSTVASVRREDAAGSGLCADAGGEPLELEFSGTGEALSFGLTGDETPDLLATRCAGPLLRDLRAVLPTRRLAMATVRRGARDVDLRADAPFLAAGLAGTVHSDLVLHLGKGDSRRLPATPAAGEAQRTRTMATEFRVERVVGGVDVTLTGRAEATDCGPLDACGLHGTRRITPRLTRGAASLYAFAPAKHSRRALRAAIGLAPGGVPKGVEAFGSGILEGRGTLTDSIGRLPESPCTDSATLGDGALFLRPQGTRVTVQYVPSTTTLRTHCPGPPLPTAVAGTRVPLRAFAKPRITLHLRRGITQRSDGYSLRTRPDLTIVLRRVRVEERITKTPGLAEVIGG